jgi:hypothetical protein
MAKKSAARKAVKKTAKKSLQKVAKKAAKVAVKKSTTKAVKRTANTAKSSIEKNTVRYFNYVPKTISAGKILCHGGVIPQTPDQKPGVNGFRPWIDDDAQSQKYGPCNCGWSGLPHYMPLAWLESDRREYDARKFPRK